MKLYRIFLPKNYNDGRPIPAVKIRKVTENIRERFGGYSFNPFAKPPVIAGVWTDDRSKIYTEPMQVIELFVEDTFKNKEWLEAFKVLIKQELDQKDIFIIVQDAEILL